MMGETGDSRGRFVDFHSHILPQIDDGSRDVNMSVAMLDMLKAQGVGRVVATPHFYPRREDPKGFLKRRAEAERILSEAMNKRTDISVISGAEVEAFSGMSRCEDVKNLCVSGTDLLLLEMPFGKWHESLISEIFSLRYRFGITPVIAHVERYLQYHNREAIDLLIEEDIAIQINSAGVELAVKNKKTHKMISEGRVLLGSDCHDLSDRAPDFAFSADFVEKKFGERTLDKIIAFSDELLRGAMSLSRNR